MSIQLLCVGDIHLGRRPGGVPSDLARSGVDPSELAPKAAWAATVREACTRGVDAVLLLGDVVDHEEYYLEGYTALENGIRELTKAGIDVVAVAGNHDVHVLPQLADVITGLKLLGRGGSWGEHIVDRPGRGAVRLVGWSFPRPHVESDPTQGASFSQRNDIATIGLLHGDLDAASSRYAPLSRERLARAGYSAWLLGHVHRPTFSPNPPGIGYLGSLVGLDPTEVGVHGPWQIEVDTGTRRLRAQHLPLAPLRWALVELTIDGLAGPEELEPAIIAAVRSFAEREDSSLGAARAIGLRLRMVGRHHRHRDLARSVAALDLSQLRPSIGGRTYFLESVEDSSQPEVDLETLARGSDPPGLLARKLLALRGRPDEPERKRLVAAARRRVEELADRRPFPRLGFLAFDDETLVDQLHRAGLDALESLLAQREGHP